MVKVLKTKSLTWNQMETAEFLLVNPEGHVCV